ncbi:MAG: hypothetical protein RL514_1152 [Verrucomicrobiota bacterium]|jgi:hypothetical protein
MDTGPNHSEDSKHDSSGVLFRVGFGLFTARLLKFGAAFVFVGYLLLLVRQLLYEFGVLRGTEDWPGMLLIPILMAPFILLPAWALFSLSSKWERSLKLRRELALVSSGNPASDAPVPSS